MPLTIEATVTGSNLALQLSGDDEEMAYFLDYLANATKPESFTDVAEMLPYGSKNKVVSFLREVADVIEAGEG